MDKHSFFAAPIVGLFIKIVVAINSAAIFIIAASPTTEDTLPYIQYWPWFILSTPIVLFFLWKHYKAFNTQLDVLVSDALSGNNNKPIVLYLRPFVTDGYILDGGDTVIETIKGSLLLVNTITLFEGRLLSVVSKKFIPIKFDQSDENESKNVIYKIRTIFSYRFGRHFDNTTDWLNTVGRTLNRSALCIIIPPAIIGSSTTEEIETALDCTITDKLVFIMPGKGSSFKAKDGVKVSAKQLWENLLQITKGNIQLPGYSKKGGFVFSINGRMTLIESCQGFDWSHKKAMKKIFIDGKLTCSKWLSSLKITYKLVWLFFPLSFLYAVILLITVFPNLSETEKFGPSIAVVFFFILLLHMRTFYRFCTKFLLTKGKAISLFVGSVVSFTIGVVAAIFILGNWGIFLVDMLGLSWITKPELGSTDFSPSYTLFGLFLLMCTTSTLVYLTAYLFFRRQPKLEFRAVSRVDKNQSFTS